MSGKYLAEHAAVRADGLAAVLAVVAHLDAVLAPLLLRALAAVHRAQQLPDVVHEALAVRKTAEQQRLAAVRALGLALLDPGAQAVLAGQLAAGGTHARLLHRLQADVALQEVHFPVARLHLIINPTDCTPENITRHTFLPPFPPPPTKHAISQFALSEYIIITRNVLAPGGDAAAGALAGQLLRAH